MSEVELGRLTRIQDIRTIWSRERQDFSRWLLDNGDYLAEVLGIELELDHQEEPVGDFSLDLIGRDLTHGAVLMVENQLEATDHTHLGQVVLYAAGTGAQFHFFGVEVAAVRIGESLPAPLLSLAVEPSDWQRRVRERADASALSGKAPLYVDFWARFLERCQTEHPGWTRRRDGTRSSNWLDFPSGITGTHIAASFAQGHRLRHELYIDGGEAERNLELFGALEAQRHALDEAYGGSLTFEPLPERRASRVADYFDGADVSETDRHDEFIDWFFDTGERLRRALQSIDVPGQV